MTSAFLISKARIRFPSDDATKTHSLPFIAPSLVVSLRFLCDYWLTSTFLTWQQPPPGRKCFCSSSVPSARTDPGRSQCSKNTWWMDGWTMNEIQVRVLHPSEFLFSSLLSGWDSLDTSEPEEPASYIRNVRLETACTIHPSLMSSLRAMAIPTGISVSHVGIVPILPSAAEGLGTSEIYTLGVNMTSAWQGHPCVCQGINFYVITATMTNCISPTLWVVLEVRFYVSVDNSYTLDRSGEFSVFTALFPTCSSKELKIEDKTMQLLFLRNSKHLEDDLLSHEVIRFWIWPFPSRRQGSEAQRRKCQLCQGPPPPLPHTQEP